MVEYRCTVERCLDGDTVEAVIDLGFDCWYKSPVRLKGINAPELKGATYAAGERARDFLAGELAKGPVVIRTELRRDKDKYGRVLGTFLVQGVDVNQAMIAAGHAVPYLV